MTYETIKMEITANPAYVSIIRLTTSGIANKVGFCMDDIEDLKVAVSEACTNAIKHSSDDRFTIIYTMIENGLTIEIIDNASHITKDVKNIIEIITKITGLFRVFKFFKK